MHQTGFVGIDITAETADFIYADEKQWWSALWTAGIRRRLEVLSAPELERVKAEMLDKVQSLKRADGIHTLWRALLGCAQKPLR